MGNQIQKTGSTSLDISAFKGFSAADLVPSNLILIQGDNDLKGKIGCSNGDFVADNVNLGPELEFSFIKSDFLYDLYTGALTEKKGRLEIGSNNEYQETIEQDNAPPSIQQIDPNDEWPVLFQDDQGLYYQSKVVFIMMVNEMPYRLVFKSRSKHIAAKGLFNTITKATKALKLEDPREAVFKLFAKKMKGKDADYWSLDCSYLRPATEQELITIANFQGVDVKASKEEE